MSTGNDAKQNPEAITGAALLLANALVMSSLQPRASADQSPDQIDPNMFLTERYTITDFNRESISYSTKDDYIRGLVKTLAYVDDGRFILKKKDKKEKITFEIVTSKDLLNIFKVKAKYTEEHIVTQDDIDKAIRSHKKKPILGEKLQIKKSVNVSDMLSDKDVSSKFKHFENISIVGDDEHTFGLFRPPNPLDSYIPIQNNPELINDFMKLIEDQLFDENAIRSWRHFIMTNAYLLKYHQKPNVFFVKFSSTGETGKNFIDKAFSKLYEGFTLLGVTEQQLAEKHNGGMVDKLYRSYDEFSTTNYSDKSINNIVKRLTNDTMAARAMGVDTKEVDDLAIDVLNTNDPGIYGMVRSNDDALKSRLCIMRMKERTMKESPYASAMNTLDDKSFAYSLYCYLMGINLDDYVKQKAFSRYPLEETSKIIRQLNEIRPSTLEDFLDSIHDEFQTKETKDKRMIDFIKVSDLNYKYKQYMAGNKYKLSDSALKRELEEMGIHKARAFKIGQSTYSVYWREHVEKEPDEIVDLFEENIEFPFF